MDTVGEQRAAMSQVLSFDQDDDQSSQDFNHNASHENVLQRFSHDIFRYDHLDRQLERHHITGIAFSGAVGIGLFQNSGQILAIGGPVGALLAFIFGGLVVISVMRSLAEMVSVRPVKGAVMDYPDVFVDEALGFAVGLLYW